MDERNCHQQSRIAAVLDSSTGQNMVYKLSITHISTITYSRIAIVTDKHHVAKKFAQLQL